MRENISISEKYFKVIEELERLRGNIENTTFRLLCYWNELKLQLDVLIVL